MAIPELFEAERDLRDFFYPNRYWGGYARFFKPHIPGRIGTPLIQDAHTVTQRQAAPEVRLRAAERLIELLSQAHEKNQHVKYSQERYRVVCKPTEAAAKAIGLLKRFVELTPKPASVLVQGRPAPRINKITKSDDGYINIRLDSAEDPTFWLELWFTQSELDRYIKQTEE